MINALVLHRLGDARLRREHEDVSIASFAMLVHLLDGGVTIDVATRQSGGTRSNCLTFDDGHETDFTVALPMLAEVGMTATSFIVTEWIGKPGFVTSAQLRELSRAGWQIGSHSVTHPDLLSLSPRVMREELTGSRCTLEDLLGSPVTAFAFPFGRENTAVLEAALDAGYVHCCTSRHGLTARASAVVCRNSVHGMMSDAELERIVAARWGMRLRWRAEDTAKAAVKLTLSPVMYRRIRRLLLGK